jgi:hypothetical protein
MSDGDIDYSRYTREELEEGLAGIDPRRFPRNYANLCAAYERLTSRPAPAPRPLPMEPARPDDDWPGPRYDADDRYVPNRLTPGERVAHVLLALGLLGYGSWGMWRNDFYIPGRRWRNGIHLQDLSASLFFAAVVCACVIVLSIVVDHYDRRDNEINYRRFARAVAAIALCLFGLSLLIAFVRDAQGG